MGKGDNTMFKSGQIVKIVNEKEFKEKGLCIPTYIQNFIGEDLIVKYSNENYSILEFIDGEVIINETNGEDLKFHNIFLKISENNNIKELKVGDKISFLDNLSPFRRYGDIMTSPYMSSFRGKQCTISSINKDNTFNIKEDTHKCCFSRGMTNEYSMIDNSNLEKFA